MANAVLTTSSIIQQSMQVLQNEFAKVYQPIYSLRKQPDDLYALDKHVVFEPVEVIATDLTYDEVCALYKLTYGGEPRWDTEAK